jgi:zinc/manganese transport system substrate-binding protein
MKFYKLLLFYFLCSINLFATNLYVASNNALGEIIKEVVGTKGRVVSVADVTDPTKYEPGAILLTQISSASALFYSSDELDTWVSKLSGVSKFSMVKMLGNEGITKTSSDSNSIVNPYFWLDPMTVKGMLSKLADTLSKIDPENSNDFKANASLFSDRLDLINTQVKNYMSKHRGKKILTFGSGLEYFAKRNNLNILSNVTITNHENSTLIESLKVLANPLSKKVIFAFKEMQNINDKNNSYAIGAYLYYIDLFGSKQKKRYSDLIIGNARVISKALE